MVFDCCGSCQPGRCYCRDACSEAARAASARAARAKYNDRGSEEGRKIHRLEEQERRSRASKKQVQEEHEVRVGDHRCQEGASGLQMAASAAPASSSAAEVLDVAPVVECAAAVRASCAAVVEWVLVASLELVDPAQRRLGGEAVCPFCGQRGRIVRVVSIKEWREEWRQRIRHGFG